MRIAVVIPTRGNRPEFLEFAYKQINKQTRKPDQIITINYPSFDGHIDIADRYKKGFEGAKAFDCDLVVCWEDDDYYSPKYIEFIEREWEIHKKPVMFGINHTIYYNILTNEWVRLDHPGRSSMMNLSVTTDILKLNWCAPDYAYLDFHLWTKTNGNQISINAPEGICISMKHGIGLCGGGGHVKGWKHYRNTDKDWSKLTEWIKDEETVNFYKSIHEKQLHIQG